MKEYIDREAARDLMEQVLGDEWKIQYAIDCLNEIPAADVVKVRHGEWIIDRAFGNDVLSGEQMVICSVCDKGIFWGKQNYCPNCGAKMDGGVNDAVD